MKAVKRSVDQFATAFDEYANESRSRATRRAPTGPLETLKRSSRVRDTSARSTMFGSTIASGWYCGCTRRQSEADQTVAVARYGFAQVHDWRIGAHHYAVPPVVRRAHFQEIAHFERDGRSRVATRLHIRKKNFFFKDRTFRRPLSPSRACSEARTRLRSRSSSGSTRATRRIVKGRPTHTRSTPAAASSSRSASRTRTRDRSMRRCSRRSSTITSAPTVQAHVHQRDRLLSHLSHVL